ncbi:MAG: hypothetical protein H0W44_10150 [Gammaproteobacteria bacterium]|nr:hypothetical protein [Gammaproteobacteria bacterium]
MRIFILILPLILMGCSTSKAPVYFLETGQARATLEITGEVEKISANVCHQRQWLPLHEGTIGDGGIDFETLSIAQKSETIQINAGAPVLLGFKFRIDNYLGSGYQYCRPTYIAEFKSGGRYKATAVVDNNQCAINLVNLNAPNEIVKKVPANLPCENFVNDESIYIANEKYK